MTPPFALPPPDFPLPAYVRQAESGLLMPRKAVLPGLIMPPGLVMGGQKKVPLLSDFRTVLSSSTDRSTYNFSFNAGPPSEDLHIVVLYVTNLGYQYMTFSTPNGNVTATNIIGDSSKGAAIAHIPSGGFVGLVVTANNFTSYMGVGIIAIHNLKNPTPIDAVAVTETSSNIVSANINCAANGSVVALVWRRNGSGAAFFSGLTSRFSETGRPADNHYMGIASDDFPQSISGRTISASFVQKPTECNLVVCSFAPG